MGRNKVERPEHLARKLRQLRVGLNLSQEQMFEKLKETAKGNVTLHFGYLTSYENNRRVPSLPVLLAYSRLGSVSLETLVDDDLELPGIRPLH